MNNAAPGWYPSPDEPGNERYYDGQTWSEHRRRVPVADAPVEAVKPRRSGRSKALMVLGGLGGSFVGLVLVVAVLQAAGVIETPVDEEIEAVASTTERRTTTTEAPTTTERRTTTTEAPTTTERRTTTTEAPTTTERRTTTTEPSPSETELLAAEISDDFDRVDSVEFFEATAVLRVEGFIETPSFGVGIIVRDELSDVVQDVSKTGLEFDQLDLQLVMELVDQLGNIEEEIVLNVSWDADTVRSINWDNFNQENILVVGETTYVHPALREALE